MPQRNYHVFNFLATFDLLPTAHLIVYYFKKSDIVSTKIDIDIRENLNNFVKLKLSETQVRPGETVNIDIASKPKSYVALLGVDQSVLLLKKNNDLNIDDAWNERELYQYQFHERNAKSTLGHSPYYYNRYWADFQVKFTKSSNFFLVRGLMDILYLQSARMILFTNARQDGMSLIQNMDNTFILNAKICLQFIQ